MRKFIVLQLITALAIGGIGFAGCALPVTVVKTALGGGATNLLDTGEKAPAAAAAPAAEGEKAEEAKE
jgi:hypothetical protein